MTVFHYGVIGGPDEPLEEEAMIKHYTAAGVVLTVGLVLIIASACDSPRSTAGPDSLGYGPSFVMWGLNWCQPCRKEQPGDTEQIIIDEAFQYHVSESCVDAYYGEGAYEWLSDVVMAAQVGLDLDVMTMSEWDYARGYWVESSLRYQYWGYPIWLAQQIIDEDELENVARTLVHETGHEFGEEDEQVAEWIAVLCTY